MEQFEGSRPLTARSVIASTLLGTHPPRLSSRQLVRAGQMFGIAEGTVRTALSRMVATGELMADDGGYRLAGALLARQARQDASRRPARRAWHGEWDQAVVRPERRTPAERAELRDAMRLLRLAELHEGIWLRPANLDPARLPEAGAVVEGQCLIFVARPVDDDAALAAALWDLDGWSGEARSLEAALVRHLPALERHDPTQLAEQFVIAAAVLRHFLADPLLPADLLPADWPGDALRATYERFDEAFKATWRVTFSAPS